MTRARLMLVALAALAAGVGAALLAAGRVDEPYQTADAPLALLVGWTFVASGLVAWRQRPGNRLGPVMIFTGFAWFATFLTDAHAGWPFTLGTAIQSVYLVGFVYLVLSFPTGRLRGRADMALIAGAIALVTVVEWTSLLFSESHAVLCDRCPPNVLLVERNDGLASGLLQLQRITGVALALLTVVLLVRRWRAATAAERRSVAPVLWAGSATVVVLAVSIANDVVGEPLGQLGKWALYCVFASVPIAVLVVLLQRRLARGAVAGLVVELGEGADGTDLRDALARALGDPSLDVAYWFPSGDRYVDRDGQRIELPGPGTGRTATVVERDGQPIAALVHDTALAENAELVRSVCAAAALTLENERLQAALRARLAELQASRARLVEATETERRRIERDLHDGTQQRLVSLAMSLGLAESKLADDPSAAAPLVREARETLALALAELRELSQGIYPSLLTERGLGAALDDLCRRAALPATLDASLPVRLPQQVEAAAYFVTSEALANAAKHSHATEVRIRARLERGVLLVEIADDGIGGAGTGSGTGLRGLADRVEALGGRLTLSSPPGRGTTIRAEIPCA
ncbi:MAG TPA: histidine kinase [Gaiella sp.]|nr:histidine kinase [Gaiella sp.]